ncbi:CpsB/CapC family capsule biosynthesis tyrosine phosphatase [Desulfosporosinus sp. FKA]|uniref:tyrosine-protein phosphatase n=1 Tax=Desulfosporosinus sp. FKA TaxID=1969834 RepID=UPI000B4A2EBB|nr:CpsB/CapC family capsule biosynthesis tyrosine phosphatase [Desulfosporosinus sp. FKA]
MIDTHSHILPGLDDGSKTMEESLDILRQLQKAGFETILATPHVLEGKDFLSPEEILTAAEEVRRAASKAGISAEIIPGSENYIFPDMAKWLREGKLLTLGNTGKYLLVELPMLEIPHYADQVFFELQVEGVTPILAHPERYLGLFQEAERALEWVKKGVLFQLDYRSVTGRYGSKPKQLAERMLSSGIIHFLGSDAHRVSSSDFIDREALQYIRQLVGKEEFRKMTVINPRRMIEGETIPSGGDFSLKEMPGKREKRKHRFWDWLRG